MFVDRAKVDLQAGKGGDGMIAFHTEKYISRGGPSGGNGGRGGSIIFKATRDVNTLYRFHHTRIIKAEDGQNGMTKKRYGRSAKDVIVEVPIGTVIYQEPDHHILVDLANEDQEFIIAKGGRGGRGNASFKSSVNRAPRIAENGMPGQVISISLELKLLADVGLVGLPSVGKSTLLSVISNAKPEIADYEFTTLVPNLGVVELPKYEPFVVADLPGLIEGASQGKGLGLQFLRHLERCRIIIHLIDMSSSDNPVADFKKINAELKSYSQSLIKRPMIIAASKMDSPNADKHYQKLKKDLKKYEIFPISSHNQQGINELITKTAELLKQTPVTPLVTTIEADKYRVYKPKIDPDLFTITKKDAHTFVITGERIERAYLLINTSTDEGILKLLNYLSRINVEEKLQELGAKDGDTVILCDFQFEYYS
jgi:GTPase